ncbi:hypothetical protein KFK09_020205 [Dendrobium nobile]|uniref:Uncharacterized protein n=1 Tax=Dendrobium nobile TaxID=94219 RepID=A0A8T3ASM7_DENNO|nr:hypothetical protein KFK09_020202 [Dendrobium nobile]KAI0499302.1 hypothetical protein KFK09_020205 [Dendrobium nobile]
MDRVLSEVAAVVKKNNLAETVRIPPLPYETPVILLFSSFYSTREEALEFIVFRAVAGGFFVKKSFERVTIETSSPSSMVLSRSYQESRREVAGCLEALA